MFDPRGELPLLPFGNPIGFVPASRGGVLIESKSLQGAFNEVHVNYTGAAPASAEYTPYPLGLFTISDREFASFRALILQEAGISLGDSKRHLICARLGRRLRRLGLQTFSQYYAYLMSCDPGREERLQMVNCITTNKTDFFRENHHFEFLRDRVFPELRERALAGKPRRLRIWSAGCSSGEEPYSIAIAVREFFSALPGWDVKILASDIDTEMLRTAEQGIYAAERLAGVPEELRRRHFLRGRGEWAG